MTSAFSSGEIILASQSPRRKELLRSLIKDFEVVPSEVNEKVDTQLTPEANAVSLARAKANWVASRYKEKIVIGADTIVVLDGKIIGKPKDEADACRLLKMICGLQHQVITGLAVVVPKKDIFEATVISTVNIKRLTEEEIIGYVRTGEPLDKAGAYAIQGRGAFMVESYEGSFSNIVGLPLEKLKNLLLQAADITNTH